jgi:hypothetical protein
MLKLPNMSAELLEQWVEYLQSAMNSVEDGSWTNGPDHVCDFCRHLPSHPHADDCLGVRLWGGLQDGEFDGSDREEYPLRKPALPKRG